MENSNLEEYTELFKFTDSCRKQAMKKAMTEYYYSHIKAMVECNEDTDDIYIQRMRELRADVLKYQKKKPGTNYYFVTVAPKMDTSIAQLVKSVDKYIGRRFVEGSMYSYEWTNAGTPHVHMLINQTTITDSDFRKNTKNTFKNLVGNLKCIDIKSVPHEWIDDKKDYIRGLKWDEGKDAMIEIDKLKRIEYDLQPYYITGTFADPLLDEAKA